MIALDQDNVATGAATAPVGAALGAESCCPPVVAQPFANITISKAAQISNFIVVLSLYWRNCRLEEKESVNALLQMLPYQSRQCKAVRLALPKRLGINLRALAETFNN